MTTLIDGPAAACFRPLPLAGGTAPQALTSRVSADMAAAAVEAPLGEVVAYGIPFHVGGLFVIDAPVTVAVDPVKARWLVFLHTADRPPMEKNAHGVYAPMRGEGKLGEAAAKYAILYEDGTEASAPVRRRFEVNLFQRRWGENSFLSVPAHKPVPRRASHEQLQQDWGQTQTRVNNYDWMYWTNWLWAWQNPYPEKPIRGLRFTPCSGVTGPVVLSAVSIGDVGEHPLRWERRRKAVLRLPEGEKFQPDLDAEGRLEQIRLDLGQVISVLPRPLYPTTDWSSTYNNQLPGEAANELLVEYTAHPDAAFHLWDGRVVPARALVEETPGLPLEAVVPAHQRVNLRVVERGSGRVVAAKLHLHGAAGEYLPPVDRHRIINAAWFEDYSVDYSHNGDFAHPGKGAHSCTYIPGETTIDLPLGAVYAEVSKGFEIRPVRTVLEITPDTEEVVIEVEKVLHWRERGWVTADTHVHFLSPGSALLEGAGEGVNIVNLLASQWGELMTNVGDFDGHTTWGSREAGGDGEYLVRVGTENRQSILGHISLLGYSGKIIAPMTTSGPDESALGDPVEALLTEWAQQCKAQGGLVVLPHFPNPRAEHAASIVSGVIDALEMTSWNNLYSGIDPYSLSDWYRYLNCGYLLPAVGGTDKMWSGVAVGAVRTYARIPQYQPFTYTNWMDAVRRAETFVTYGPLLDFAVDGRPSGSRIALSHSGGTLDVTWQVATVTVPTTRVELVVNGEIRASAPLAPEGGSGSFSLRVEGSCWAALLVRGGYPDQPEIVAAHSSPVMVVVEGSPLLAAADAVTILEQIEGALAFIDTIGTRATDRVYKRMRLTLTSAHRGLHNRMHKAGHYHEHHTEEHD